MITSNKNYTDNNAETLAMLSDAKMSSMQSTDALEYLMDAMEYLKSGDLTGWQEKFNPVQTITPPPAKRLRQCPSIAPVLPMDLCMECKSEDVIDDIHNGQIVCITCGLIQQRGVFTGDTAHCSYDRMRTMSAVHIHRYSRVKNFIEILRLGEGDSRPMIDQETMKSLQVAVDGLNVVDDISIRKVLRTLGLSQRYRRHSMFFVHKFGGRGTCPMIKAADVFRLVKMFRRVEVFFDLHRHKIWPNRKTFFSYKFILYQLLNEMGKPELTGPHHLLKSKKLLNVQRDAYYRICRYTTFKLFQ